MHVRLHFLKTDLDYFAFLLMAFVENELLTFILLIYMLGTRHHIYFGKLKMVFLSIIRRKN